MRHGKRINHLGRTATHRKAMLSNLASSLFLHKRVNTTLAKAKALRQYVEPLITKAKIDTTHTRRVVFSYLQDKESLKALYNEVVDRVGDRPGGYTRIIKLGTRLGDNAEMAMIELVDFNDFLTEETTTKKAKTRRSRRGGKKGEDTLPKDEAPAKKKKEVKEEKPVAGKPAVEEKPVAEEKPVDEEKVVAEEKTASEEKPHEVEAKAETEEQPGEEEIKAEASSKEEKKEEIKDQGEEGEKKEKE